MTDLDVASAAADFVKYFVERLDAAGVPVVTPAGGLACHVDARKFLSDIPSLQYPAGALAAAIYLISGVRCMERGTISMDRDRDGNEVPSDLELVRLAVPRRVYTMSHIEYTVDRLTWLYKNRDLVKGLKFVSEPPVLRFFFGRLAPLEEWDDRLAETFQADFGPGL
jgi:tryptophanase